MRLSVNVQSYVFHITVENRQSLRCSALRLGDDFRKRSAHRLSPNADSLESEIQFLLFLVFDFELLNFNLDELHNRVNRNDKFKNVWIILWKYTLLCSKKKIFVFHKLVDFFWRTVHSNNILFQLNFGLRHKVLFY